MGVPQQVYAQNQGKKYSARIEEWFTPIEPSYKRSDLEDRLKKYDFLHDFNVQALTIEWCKIVEFLDTNHIDTTANHLFIFHDWRFLNAALYLDQRLAELETMYDENMWHVENLLKRYNAMLDSARITDESIQKSQKDTSNATKTAQSQSQQKTVIGKLKTKIRKAADEVDTVWIQIVKLFPIIEYQLNELSGTDYAYSEKEREIIQNDYKIAKNIFSRISLLHKKSFKWSEITRRLFQLPSIPGWTIYHTTYNNIKGIYPDSNISTIVVRP